MWRFEKFAGRPWFGPRTTTVIDQHREWLADHLDAVHNVGDYEALREASLVALDRRHLREHMHGYRHLETDLYWRELGTAGH